MISILSLILYYSTLEHKSINLRTHNIIFLKRKFFVFFAVLLLNLLTSNALSICNVDWVNRLVWQEAHRTPGAGKFKDVKKSK